MSAWPQLRETRVVRSGSPLGTVVSCSLTDMMLSGLPVSVVFFYRVAPDLGRLADGLARALGHVPAFGGRLRSAGDSLEIVCDDAGVPLAVYDLDDTLPEAIARATLPAADQVDHVDAPRARAGADPLLTVRVSLLSDGGMALGCSWHHAVGDMAAFMVFMRAWSAFTEGGRPPATDLVTDRETYLDTVLPEGGADRPGFKLPEGEHAAELDRHLAAATRANRTTQIHFPRPEVDALRAAVTADAGRRLSTNDVVCAHVASTVRALDEDTEPRWFAMPVNVRRTLGLPDDVVGNFVSEVFLPAPADRTAHAVAIRAEVDAFASRHLNLRANREFVRRVGPARVLECVPTGFDPGNRTLSITNWSRFGVYGVVFDGTAPAFFSPTTNLALPWVGWLVEGFDDSGLLCTLTLPAKLAGRLRAPAGQALLHAHRPAGTEVPALAARIRKLA